MRLLTLLFAGMSLGSVPLCGQTVDVHTHIIIPEYVEMLKAHGAELEETFPLPAWDVGRHIAFMDSAGIRTAVLTMPAPQPYYGETEESAECIRRVNEVSARVKQNYPGRFKFCAALPLPDVDAAIREAIYALDTLGADGVKLATNSRGQYLGDEALDPLMEVLNERHAVIIIHPHRPTPYPEKIIATTPLAMYEYPAETTRAVVNMLARNVLVRYPNLKVVVPHCGSFLSICITFATDSCHNLFQFVDTRYSHGFSGGTRRDTECLFSLYALPRSPFFPIFANKPIKTSRLCPANTIKPYSTPCSRQLCTPSVCHSRSSCWKKSRRRCWRLSSIWARERG